MDTTQIQTGSSMIAHIADPQLRNALISTAENVEKMLELERITPATKLVGPLPYGLIVEITLDYKGKDKPTVFTFTYRLDKGIMERWLSENPHLTEGILSFIGKGIEITIPPGKLEKQVNKAGFSIDGSDGERDWMPLLDRPITFKAHRNVFGGKEWECFYVDEQQ